MYILEYVSSTCDVTAQEIQADSSLRFLTSTGYNEGSGSYIKWVENIFLFYISQQRYISNCFYIFSLISNFSNMDCWWRIDSGGDDLKLLLFLTRDLACPGDKISIYDGKPHSRY